MRKSAAIIPWFFAITGAVGWSQPETTWPTSSLTPAELQLAHKHYLDGDFAGSAAQIKQVLVKFHSDQTIVKNAIALSESIQARLGCEPYPANWQLPDKILDLRISQSRRESQGRVSYRLNVSGVSTSADEVAQLQLRAADGQIFLDKSRSLGEWSVEKEEDGFKFDLEQGRVPNPMDSGLYFVTIETKGGQRVEGYVILSNHVASASPQVLRPHPNQRVASANPVVQWVDFRSPEWSQCEIRSVYLGLWRSTGTVWWRGFFRENLPTSTIIGPEGEPGVERLTAGRYTISVRFNELRKFGPVKIRRIAMTNVPFSVDL